MTYGYEIEAALGGIAGRGIHFHRPLSYGVVGEAPDGGLFFVACIVPLACCMPLGCC